MCLAASRAVKNAPSRLTRITRRHSSLVISTKLGAWPPTPALTKHESIRPSSASGVGHRLLDRLLVTDVAHDRQQLDVVAAELFDRRVVLVGVRPPDRHVGTVRSERVGHSQSDAAVAAGDQGDVAGEVEGGTGGKRHGGDGRAGHALRQQWR